MIVVAGGNVEQIFVVRGGASSLTPMQLRDYAIDSQVLFAITLP